MSTKKPRILICDDDQLYHQALTLGLGNNYEVKSVYDGDQALDILKKQPFELVLLDIQIRSNDEGLRYIPLIKKVDPDIAVVMSSGLTDFDSVRQALRNGADDYLAKDGAPDELRLAVDMVLDRRQNKLRHSQQSHELSTYQDKHVLIGESKAVNQLRRILEKARDSKANVLIHGEAGTGKEVAARLLRSQREDGTWIPFVSVDSSTIQSTTAESMLFGHERGAFTGADRVKKGLFEEADGGIIYFDEVGNMSLDIQAKMLRVFQEKEVTRMGSAKALSLDFRVVAASNRNLEEMVKSNEFRFDLLSRLGVIPINIPPLRDRKEDLPLLINHFLQLHCPPNRKFKYEPRAEKVLLAYDWPGNIRELSNVVLYGVTMGDSECLGVEDLPPKFWSIVSTEESKPATTASPSAAAGTKKFYDRVKAFEKELLESEFKRFNGNIAQMARELEMDRSHLHVKLKSYGIHSSGKSASE